MSIVEEIKQFFANFPKYARQPFAVTNEQEYQKAEEWAEHVRSLFIRQLVIFLLVALLECVGLFAVVPIRFALKLLLVPFAILAMIWLAVGTTVILLYKKEIFDLDSMVRWGKAGYDVGKQFETTHVTVTHEFGNQYRVNSHTENKGCLFAIIALGVRCMIFAPYCMIMGLPLTYKKYKDTRANMEAYRANPAA